MIFLFKYFYGSFLLCSSIEGKQYFNIIVFISISLIFHQFNTFMKRIYVNNVMLRIVTVSHTTCKSSCVSFESSISISWLITGEDKDISVMSLPSPTDRVLSCDS